MADVAVVGFPNSGKSTFVSTVSAAKPRVAPYPFTTLQPHLGVVRLGSSSSPAGEFVIADTPGLIEGASEGRGLGHQFLRHIERARLLLILVDLASIEGYSPHEQESVLINELGRYNEDLLRRPRLIVGSKKDIATDYAMSSNGYPPYSISAVQGSGVTEVLWKIWQMLQEMQSIKIPSYHQSMLVVHRPEPKEGVLVVKEREGMFVVRGKAVERAVALSDLTDPQAASYVQDRLRRLGVDNALVSAGVKDGDVVQIGELEFTYFNDSVISKKARSR
jgi:GTP-binding protein